MQRKRRRRSENPPSVVWKQAGWAGERTAPGYVGSRSNTG